MKREARTGKFAYADASFRSHLNARAGGSRKSLTAVIIATFLGAARVTCCYRSLACLPFRT